MYELVEVLLEEKPYLFLVTNTGYGLSFNCEEVPLVGVKAAGVKAQKLKDDYVVSASNFSYTDDEFITIITDKGTGKRVRLNEFEISSRTRRGLLVIREVKSNPYQIVKAFITDTKKTIGIKNSDITYLKLTELPIADRYSTGSQITKHKLVTAFIEANLVSKKDNVKSIDEKENTKPSTEEKAIPKKDRISLKEIDDRLMTIDDFLKKDD